MTLSADCAQHTFGSRDYWRCLTVQKSVPYGHASGSCGMGGAGSVLDPQLRVRGLHNLTVADGSAVPHVICGNSIGMVLMVAEKAADIIKARHQVA